MFSPQGQVWGLPPLNPITLRNTAGDAFAELLAANMRHAGALRIDHVMGLERLFCIPDGAPAREGAYLRYPRETLLRRLTLESRRATCLVVGEDLGTVPDGLRERLRQADIQSYRVLWLERDGPAFRPPQAYPARSVACVTTHDLPTLAGWWRGADIAERLALNLLTPGEAEAETATRETARHALREALEREGLPTADADLPASLHAFIAASPAALILIQTDDLAGETTAVNLPGTDHERPNWRRRLRTDLAGLFTSRDAQAILQAVRARRSGSPTIQEPVNKRLNER
jgi:glycogen operon protein